MTFVLLCPKCRKDAREYLTVREVGERLVALATQAVEEPCPDCRLASQIIM